MKHYILRFGLFALLLIFSLSGTSEAFTPNDENFIEIDAICQIESGCRNLIGDFGRSIGPYQIQEGVVRDFNRREGENYSHGDMRDFQKAGRVASWYLNDEIPRMLEHFRIVDTWENRIIAYNAGIGRAVQINRKGAKIPPVTMRYIEKYSELTYGR